MWWTSDRLDPRLSSPTAREAAICFVIRTGSDGRAVGVETGAPRLLVSFEQPVHQARRPDLATDGQRFFFTLTKSESDVWVVGLER